MPNPPAKIIKGKCISVVESYKFTRQKNCNWASSLTKLAHATALEYEDRFLIELIQNGYDVHDAHRTDGQIWIHFVRDEGKFGTLYVANGGRPFTESNFHAICEIAQSDKEPGAGIGNKGVGFKSVLHVCDSPEIYSVNAESFDPRSFNGFCFRFARSDDYIDFCDGDESLLESMRRDVSPYFLPIHIPHPAGSLNRFVGLGLVSTIRMPLSRKSARDVASQQLEELRGSPVPVLLFLPRIGRLVIEESEYGDIVTQTEICRKEEPLAATSADIECRWSTVTIERNDHVMNGDGSSTVRRFFVATKVVEQERLKAAIRSSIEDGHLDERFSEWTEEADVSAAIELGVDTPADRRLYTYLPMGKEATCPFGGYLNAPFSPNLARTHVNAVVPLNGLFFDVAAELVCETVLMLSDVDAGIPDSVLLDLVTWEAPYTSRLASAFAARGKSLSEHPMLPLFPTDDLPCRGSIAEAYAWDGEYRVFQVERLCRTTQSQLLAAIDGATRRHRLEAFVESLDCSLRPDNATLANWAERVAKDLAAKSFDAAFWNDFYADIAAIFAGRGDALVGRRLLLDSSNMLRQAGPFRGAVTSADRPAVFFPPTTERSEDDEDLGITAGVAMPANLSLYMCYLHEELTWYERDGAIQRRTPAREFLQKAQLVQRFDTRNLIEHCSRISQNTTSAGVRESALRLAFNLQRAARSRDAIGLERLPFHVPTHDGWRLAGEALFSQQWPGTTGLQLASLFTNARAVSDDIASLEKRLLVSPTDEPFKGELVTEWHDFLSRIGVKDGLWPVEMPLSTDTFRGDELTKQRLGRALKMKDEDVAQWQLTHTLSQEANHPYTYYRVQSSFFRLPGQFDFSQLTISAKQIYARLVFSQIGAWGKEHFSVTIERPRSSGKDTLTWPTPLTAFVRHAAWVPIREDAATERYVAPCNAWHYDESDGSIASTFLPIVPRDLRRQLENSQSSRERLVDLGRLRVVGCVKDAPALATLLGDLLAANKIGEAESGSFRRLHNQAWQQMLTADSLQRAGFTNASTLFLAAHRGTELVPLKVRHEGDACCDGELFVVNSDDRLRRQLLSDLRFPTLDVGSRHGAQVVGLLKPLCGENVRPSSSVNIEVLADDVNVVPNKDAPYLFDGDSEWIKSLVALTIQLKGRVPSHHSPQAQSQVQKRLSALRAVRGDHIALRVDQSRAELPAFFHQVVLINDVEFPTIAFSSRSDSLTWDTVERLVPAIVAAADRGSIQADLEVAILRLRRSAVDDRAPEPGDEELADALTTSVAEIRALRRELRSQELVILEFLYPILYHLLGADTAASFDPRGDMQQTSRDDIRNALLPQEGNLPLTVDALLKKCAAIPNLWLLRDELELDYGRFNATLRAIGSPYKVARNEEGHRNEFAFFKQKRNEAILARVRAKFIDDFRAGRTLQPYVDVRDLKTLQADPNWLETCHLPTDTMMVGHTNVWLRALGAMTLNESPPDMKPLQTVRSDNRKIIRRLTDELWKVVPAWCTKNRTNTPDGWSQPNVSETVADAMFAAGKTDLEPLSSNQVFGWLAENGYLPVGMPHSTSLASLGLTAEDLTKRESEAEKQKRKRDYERRTIEIDGDRYGSMPDKCDALIEKIRSSVFPGFLKSSASLSRLGSASGSKKAKRKSGSGGGSGGSKGRMTDAQKHALGFAGELLAFEWLKAHYEGVMEDCWKSKYRNLVFGGDTGDDGLGYDFEVFLKNKSSYMFEVKATTGSDCVIELGATELETSQQYARTNQYRILFISNVLDADRRRIFVLPNPFSKRGRGLFETTGTGIKFRFTMQ